jgi:hypothetical protein
MSQTSPVDRGINEELPDDGHDGVDEHGFGRSGQGGRVAEPGSAGWLKVLSDLAGAGSREPGADADRREMPGGGIGGAEQKRAGVGGLAGHTENDEIDWPVEAVFPPCLH